MKIHKEKWTSEDNNEEIHFFIKGEPNTYLFGYNPKYMSEALAEKLWISCLSKADPDWNKDKHGNFYLERTV